ncbi:MAG: NYN domain-containing protein [Thermoplasmatales archaeon]|nr:NYN domain-containing protein [Thermoplasmatales archaeon]
MEIKNLSAVFIDFENFYYTLTDQLQMPLTKANEISPTLIGKELDRIHNSLGEFVIRMAFADWTDLSGPKKELQKMGIRAMDILSTKYKNSADIELSLSVQEVVLTREDVQSIVIVAGDRDYMPIALRIRERGKLLHIVGFEINLSGDLKKLVGKDNYSYIEMESSSPEEQIQSPPLEPKSVKHLGKTIKLSPDQVVAVEVAIRAFDEYGPKFGSVKLSGFLVDRFAKALPNLDHLQRKEVFGSLVDLEILRTHQKQGFLGDEIFTVFEINEENDIVKKFRKDYGTGKELLKKAVASVVDESGYVLGSKLGTILRKIDQSFSPANYGCRNVMEFTERYPDILLDTGEKAGEDRKYKIANMRNNDS